MKMNIGMQIYTLRNEMGKGLDAVLARIAEVGYQGVEMTYMPDKGDEAAELLKKHNLKGVAAHIGIWELESSDGKAIGFLKKIGADKVAIPSLPGEWLENKDYVARTAKRMDECAKKLTQEGIELSFHNHVVEFLPKYDGQTAIDIFYENAPSLKYELDIGWAFAAGADVVSVINKLGDRLHLVHIKDVDGNNSPTEIGTGKVDMKAALEAAVAVGVKWGVVEQDSCNKYPAFESIEISYDYLKTFITQ